MTCLCSWIFVVTTCTAPGGYLILTESDGLLYPKGEAPPPDGVAHDIQAGISGSETVHAMNNILIGLALKNRFVIGCVDYSPTTSNPLLTKARIYSLSYHLQDFLSNSPFTILSRQRAICPLGGCAAIEKSVRGNSLAQYCKSSSDNLYTQLDGVTRVLLDKGELEARKGVPIRSEEERLALMVDVRRTMDEGTMLVGSEWVAQKPAE